MSNWLAELVLVGRKNYIKAAHSHRSLPRRARNVLADAYLDAVEVAVPVPQLDGHVVRRTVGKNKQKKKGMFESQRDRSV